MLIIQRGIFRIKKLISLIPSSRCPRSSKNISTPPGINKMFRKIPTKSKKFAFD